MPAFLPVPRLPSIPRPALPRAAPRCCAPHARALSLDPLPSFEAFCWRTQERLCAHTAAADGLGVFHTPSTFSSAGTSSTPREATRRMCGGRAFADASIAVFTSPRCNNTTSSTATCTTLSTPPPAAAGLTLALRPRNDALPQLRAAAHYFQHGARAWWFAGSVDVALARDVPRPPFDRAARRVLDGYRALCTRFRAPHAEHERAFLAGCLQGMDGPHGVPDRETSFRFVAEFVDVILPIYLPLVMDADSQTHPAEYVDHLPQHSSSDDVDVLTFAMLQHALDQKAAHDRDTRSGFLDDDQVERFALHGGATCESATIRAAPLVSWRFSLAPSALTPAGKTYDSMRHDSRAVQHSHQSILFM